MQMHKRLVFSIALGCNDAAPCPTFADIVVTDPEGVASEQVFDEIWSTIDTFHLWTARPGVCVDEIRLATTLARSDGQNLAGYYHRGTIDIDITTAPLKYVITHELCHGLDLGLERYTSNNPLLFHATLGPEPYPQDRTISPKEVYAETCESGPLPLDLAVEASCEALPRSQFVLEQTFIGFWEQSFDWSDEVRVNRQTLPLLSGAEYSVAAGVGALYLGREELTVDGAHALSLWRIPVDGRFIDIPGPVVSSDATWKLFGSAEEGPLLVVVDGETRAWQVGPSGQQLIEVTFPTNLEPSTGVVTDGFAWVNASIGSQAPAWLRVSLTNGSVAPWALPDLIGAPIALQPGVGKIVALWLGRDWSLVRFDTATQAWSVVPLPEPLVPVAAVSLADERVMFRWLTHHRLSGFGWHDPTTGDWTLVREPCDEHRSGYAGALVAIDGQPYWFEWPDPDAGTEPALLSLVLP